METVVLLSGGLDSACLIAFYRRLGHNVSGLFIDYGQPVREREGRSARALAAHYNIALAEVDCAGPQLNYSGEIRGRNALLLFAAMVFSPLQSGIIALGIHGETSYYDCSKLFASDLKRIIDGYSRGRIALGVPFLSWTKPMIFEFAATAGVPIHLTWSCEVDPTSECGQCLSCRDRKALNVRQAK